uniref:Uncharacterized protein n=1 Tax=Rangifer tarandus platyrhynchus TaxID=3082113 RepID=A0ACB0F384_RANTA|nr:unnamed protein product [Rangifer tarandus platyrhynchus]
MEGGGEGSVRPDPEPLGFIYWERRLIPLRPAEGRAQLGWTGREAEHRADVSLRPGALHALSWEPPSPGPVQAGAHRQLRFPEGKAGMLGERTSPPVMHELVAFVASRSEAQAARLQACP